MNEMRRELSTKITSPVTPFTIKSPSPIIRLVKDALKSKTKLFQTSLGTKKLEESCHQILE